MKPKDHYRIAVTAFRASQYEESIQILNSLKSQISPLIETSSIKAYLSLEDLLNQLFITRESNTFWQRDIYFESCLLLAISYRKINQIPQAIQELKTLEVTYTQSIPLTHLIARYLAMSHQFEEAILYLTKLIRLSPQYEQAYQDLAWISNQSGNFSETIKLINSAMKTAPSEKLFEYLLVALAALNDIEALEDTTLELCLQFLNEDIAPILLSITQRLYRHKHYAKTITLTQELLKFDPSNIECLNLLVLSLLKTGQVSKACYYLLKSLDMNHESAENWYKLGISYYQWDMPLFARHALAQSLTYQTDSPELAQGCYELLEKMSSSINLENCVKSIIKRCSLDNEFATNLSTNIKLTLDEYGISCTSELERIIKKMKPNFIRKVN